MTGLITGLINLGTGEIIIIVFAIILLFGAKKIPELMHGIGKGINSFKKGMNDISDEINRPADNKENDGKDEAQK